ncbi:MAG: NitT/TauT family transport system permease protein [Puniceicoccaceae bacterium 5H]|nr:MAG: NitT/TauT family transport system permease protein [Puniceicoccaceae bacterium 5H]
MRRWCTQFWPVGLGLLGFIATWYAVIWAFDLQWFQLPSPHVVLASLAEHWRELGSAAWRTWRSASLGFLAATCLGLTTSLLFGALPLVRRVVYPALVLLQMIPIIASAAMVVILLDTGTIATVVIAFLISYFPIMANTTRGLMEVPREQLDLFQLYRARGWQRLFWLRLPQALPAFFTGLHVASTLVVIGTVTGELFATSSDDQGGLGYLIFVYRAQLKTPELYSAALLSSVLGFFFVGVVSLLRRMLLSPWYKLEVDEGAPD